MTDARLPERWLTDRRLLKLSDSAHRTFVTALLWSVANRTDGRLEVDDLDLMPRARQSDVVELVASRLFARDGTQLVLIDFPGTQTSRDELEVLENARRRDRQKKARQRADRATVPGDSPEGRPSGRVPGTAQARTGQARTGSYGTQIDADDDSRASTADERCAAQPVAAATATLDRCWDHPQARMAPNGRCVECITEGRQR